jgi:hypothetical protein
MLTVLWTFLGLLLGLLLLLLIPGKTPKAPPGGGRQPFIWDQDAVWSSLEAIFREQRARQPQELDADARDGLEQLNRLVSCLEERNLEFDALEFDELQRSILGLGPILAASCIPLEDFANLNSRLRRAIKDSSQTWNLDNPEVRDQFYQLLTLSRLSLEEIILQKPNGAIPTMLKGIDEPSQCPSVVIEGVRLHSGDIILNRGGDVTSSVIARGNDHPGVFSHASLIHVSEQGEANIIHAIIGKGTIIESPEQWLAVRTLRILVLRARTNLPQIQENPMIPHLAATAALEDARTKHLPWDFTMSPSNPSGRYCVAVVTSCYERYGLHLWKGMTTMSAPGVVNWLNNFGVSHTQTYSPSDLEYDPMLRVVAEWRHPEALYQDHINNAIIDVILEGANAGEKLGHAWYLRPPARCTKVYCVIRGWFGKSGPIPRGWSATQFLQMLWVYKRHRQIKHKTLELAEAFEKKQGYRPPFWELISIARSVKQSL